MFVLKRGGFQVEAAGPVIKADDYGKLVEAGELIEHAEAQAQEIREQAQREFEEQKREGLREGNQEAQEQMAEQTFELVERSAAYLGRVEAEVVTVVVNSLRQILSELPPEEVIVQTVRKSLGAVMANQRQVTLRVAPAQVTAVKARLAEILASFPAIVAIEVAADTRLEGTGCILETDVGVVDAGAETQLAAIERVLRKSLKRDD